MDDENHRLLMQQDRLRVAYSAMSAGSGGANDDVSAPKTPVKKKRKLPGTPDPMAEVIALSPTTLMARNRFVCEICNKGFQRDQNLQLHRRGHNLPWKLRQRAIGAETRKRVYVCPEPSCVHHNPSRALGDLTGIKKHFCRKHGEKQWKCGKCNKWYAVQSDWKAHSKTCGTKEYKCDCGNIFSRRDSFITHRAFCDALAEESNEVKRQALLMPSLGSTHGFQPQPQMITSEEPPIPVNTITTTTNMRIPPDVKIIDPVPSFKSPRGTFPPTFSVTTPWSTITMGSSANSSSATALLQSAARMGATSSSSTGVDSTEYLYQQHQHLPYHHAQFDTDALGYAEAAAAVFDAPGVDVRQMNDVDMGLFSAPVGSRNPSTRYACAGGDTMTFDFLGRRQ